MARARARALIWLQAQCILFKRYPEVLEPFKYAGYPMLLQAVALPQQDQGGDPSAHFLGPEQAPRLQVGSVLSCILLLSSPCTVTLLILALRQLGNV